LVKNLQAKCTKEFHQGFPSTITIRATPRHMMCVGVTPNDQVEMLITITYEFPQFPGGGRSSASYGR
jgi:hypothetical protein